VRYVMMITDAKDLAIPLQSRQSVRNASTPLVAWTPMSDVHQLSRPAYERLQAEYEDLTTRGRIEIAQAIERARELGDLSENGDYHAAKDQQGHMEGRIRQLEAILEHAEIIEAPEPGVVGPGTIVTIVYEGDSDDDAERYLVGHIEERTEGLEVVSPTAPLGAALIGHRTGESVEYETPTGAQMRVRILEVAAA
jgi:transcription elongation factor GreA